MIFQVTGISRSGTAWLAAFLNLHPGCFCHHELAAETSNWLEDSEDLHLFWDYVGESSTYGWLPKATRPTGPKVFIDRDPYQVFCSIWRVQNERPILTDIQAQHDAAYVWAVQQNAMIVPFTELHKTDQLQQIWSHIFGNDYTFPVAKARLFVKMNIQRIDAAEMVSNPEQAHERLFV